MPATVITYHGVGDRHGGWDPYRMLMPLWHFRWQMDFLATHRQVVSLEEAVSGDYTGDRPAVAITFDDGYESVLSVASPILDEHGFSATCFIPTAWMGRNKGWDPLDVSGVPLPIVDAKQLERLMNLGFGVESHGHEHARFDCMDTDEARNDIETSLARLAAITDRRSRFLAWPWGAHSAASRVAARQAGLVGAFSIGRPGEGDYARERVTIRPSDGRALFAFKTSGRYLSARESPWVSPVYHRVVHPLVRWRRQWRA